MKILVVSSFLPFPLFSGGHVRLYNILNQLSKHHDVTLVCEKRSHQSEKDVEEIKKFCKEIYVIPRKKQWSAGVILQTALSSYPFLLAGHDVAQMKKILAKLLEKQVFDVIHIETFYVMQNLPTTKIPTVLVEHNIEYQVYEKFMKSAPLIVRPFLAIDIEKIKYWEKKAWIEATKVAGVSEIEARYMRKDAYVVPNGVNIADFPFKKAISDKKEKTILFMGDFKWIQNTTTALWILKEIWPQITKNTKYQVKLWIVGKNIPNNLKQYGSESIVLDEHAPDKTSDIYKKADILLSPIKVGGGTSYKILEAMASGVPVVTTPLGVQGLQAEDGKHALVSESSELLAKQVLRLLENKKEYKDIAENARKLIEEKFTWDKITAVLEGVYTDAIKK